VEMLAPKTVCSSNTPHKPFSIHLLHGVAYDVVWCCVGLHGVMIAAKGVATPMDQGGPMGGRHPQGG
jgi:hypothetical protein